MGQAKPFAEVLGARIRDRRTELGRTQDEVARSIRHVTGLDWTRSVIAQIERGRRELSLPEMAILLAMLKTSLREVLKGAGPLELTPEGGGEVVGADALVDGLAGKQPLDEVIGASPKLVQKMGARMRAATEERRRIWPKSSIGNGIRAERSIGEADQKAARKLGVSARAVSLAAHRSWGHSLTAERDARVQEQAPAGASPRTLQALRGHITRGLVEDLRPILDRARKRG